MALSSTSPNVKSYIWPGRKTTPTRLLALWPQLGVCYWSLRPSWGGCDWSIATHKAELRLSRSPSLLISCSGSWPQREELLSPSARQIYKMNFPPVGFFQSRTVLLMLRQSNPITPYETWLKLFWSKFNWTEYFCGLYFDFVLSP